MAMKNKIISTPEDIYRIEGKHPNEWRKVLHRLYKENFIFENASDMNEDGNAFQKKLGISQRSLQKSLWFLNDNKLVEIKNMGSSPVYFLTPKGFDVAREEQKHTLNATIQIIIIYLTTILAITTAFELFNNLDIIEKTLLFWEYIFVVVALVFLYHFLIFRRLSK